MANDLIKAVEELENAMDFGELRGFVEEVVNQLEVAMEILANIDSEGEREEIRSAVDEAYRCVESALYNIR